MEKRDTHHMRRWTGVFHAAPPPGTIGPVVHTLSWTGLKSGAMEAARGVARERDWRLVELREEEV